MSGFMSLAEAAAKFAAAAKDIRDAEPRIIETACQMVAAKAKASIGTYDLGWPPLQPETVARKANGDTPLLETGELRASIEWSTVGLVGHVGSNLDKAVWHELGTSRGIPPRSFLMLSAVDQGPKIARMARDVLAAAFAGHGPFASRVDSIFHALKTLYEVGKWAVDDFERSTRESRRK